MYFRIFYNARQKNIKNNFINILKNEFGKDNIFEIDINQSNVEKFKIKIKDKVIFLWIQKLRKYEKWYNAEIPYEIKNNIFHIPDISELIDYIIKTDYPDDLKETNIHNVIHPYKIDLMDLNTPEFTYITIKNTDSPTFGESNLDGYFILNEESNDNKKILYKMFFIYD